MELGDGWIAEKVVATGSDSESPALVEEKLGNEANAATVSRGSISFEDAVAMELLDGGIAERGLAAGSHSASPPLVDEKSGSEANAATVSRGLLSFEDPSLCRAIPFHKVVRRGAKQLETNQGVLASYDMSRPVTKIDAFLSHNWDTPRIWKFFVFVLHFNTWKSIAIGVLTSCSTTLIAAAGHLAIREGHTGELVAEAGLFVTTPVTLLALFTLHDILDLGGVGGPQVFLDKACIQQGDESLKKKGIAKLSAFLACSSSMVICYSDIYVQKLWTVYEIGTFLCLGKPINAIHVRPLIEPVIVCAAVLLSFILNISQRLFARWAPHFLDAVILCGSFATTLAGAVCVRIVGHRRNSASCSAAKCRIENAICSKASDRDEVYRNIDELMEKCFGKRCSKTVALRAFDEFIRAEVPRAMLVCSGRACVPYRYALLVLITGWSGRMETWAAALALGEVGTRALMLKLLEITMLWLALFPLQIALVSTLATRFLLLPRWAEISFVLFIALIYTGFVVATGSVTERLRSEAEGSDAWLAGFIAWLALLGGSTAWAYRPYRTEAPRPPESLQKMTLYSL